MAEYKCYVSKHAALLDFLYPLSTWTTFEPPKTSKCSLPKMELPEQKEMERGLSHFGLIHAKNFTEIAMKIQDKQNPEKIQILYILQH